MRGRIFLIATAIVLLHSWQRADAVIKADTPLAAIVGHEYVFVGKVENYYADKPAMMVAVTENLRGKAPFKKMPINLKVDNPEFVEKNFIKPLMKRFGPDLEMVFFVKQREKKLITFGFTNGTWFHLNGTLTAEDQAVFGLLSAEPYFRKTFKGTTEELRKVLKDHYAGTGKLPPLDPKQEPGFGPEYVPVKKTSFQAWPGFFAPAPSAGGPLFAVIAPIALAAPLAILAMLFPTVFGGVFVLFRQWLAFITLISLNSTLFMLHLWVAPLVLRGTWWNTPPALWFIMTLVTAGCTLWAWRRQLHILSSGEHDAPPRTELIVLGFMTISALGTAIGVWFFAEPGWKDAGWALTVVMALGICAGLVYRGWLLLPNDSLFAAPSMASEGVILGAMLFGHVAFVPLLMGSGLAAGTTEFNEQAAKTGGKIVPGIKKWEFALTDAGFYCASPLVDGERVYASAAHPSFRGGTLVCLDRQGEKKWEFIDGGDFKQGISTPCIHDGKLYIGEGFHGDPECKVYCVDAATGLKVWEFKTKNQTESSPTVADGKLFIGAGNDGVYCFDIKKSIEQKKGVVHWHYPPKDYKGRDQRFGAGMRVVGDKVYCGTGVHRDPKYKDKGETAVFCFDADNGKVLWKTPTPFPMWSTPVVKDGFAYVTCGNGDVTDDVAPPAEPAGVLLCLDADTGKERWRYKVGNGIIESPAVDEGRIYFGCRDGNVYCVGRNDGKKRWSYFLGSPIIATPALHVDAKKQQTVNVFAVATAGKIACMNPLSGDIVWSHDLSKRDANITASPKLVVTRTADGDRRQLIIATGIGGGARNPTAHQAILFCFEDLVKAE